MLGRVLSAFYQIPPLLPGPVNYRLGGIYASHYQTLWGILIGAGSGSAARHSPPCLSQMCHRAPQICFQDLHLPEYSSAKCFLCRTNCTLAIRNPHHSSRKPYLKVCLTRPDRTNTVKKGSIQSDFGIVDNGYCHDHGWEYSLSEIRIISRAFPGQFGLVRLIHSPSAFKLECIMPKLMICIWARNELFVLKLVCSNACNFCHRWWKSLLITLRGHEWTLMQRAQFPIHGGPQGLSNMEVLLVPRWQKLCRGTGGPRWKVWTRTKIWSIRYFVAN